MQNNEKPIILKGITKVEGYAEGEALVTSSFLSHLVNAVNSDGVIRIFGHPLVGQSYAGKIVVYDTDKFSTGGAWGLYFKAKVTNSAPKALICRTVHPISIGGAIDAGIPAMDSFDVDPWTVIQTGDYVKITAPKAGDEGIIEIYPKYPARRAELAELKSLPKKGWEKSDISLTPYEQEMLAGKHGRPKQVAMERLVKFAEGMGSKRMVPICSAHLFDDHQSRDYTVGAWPAFEEFASMGAKVVVPTTVESTAMGDDLVDDKGMPWHYSVMAPAREVFKGMVPVHENLKNMGATVIPTCIPYAHLAPPKFGEYLVTSESNAAAYSNIMIGARVNRDPANMVLYAAITGVMPEYGVHLQENRIGQMIFDVDPAVVKELDDVGDYVALGGAIGFRAGDRVPVVCGLNRMTNAQAKAFCACVSPALTYPMIHIVGITPEARTIEEAFGGEIPKDVERVRITKSDLAAVYQNLRQTEKTSIDAAVIGCPFLMFEELADIAGMLDGQKVSAPLWLYTDYVNYSAAKKAGILEKIEASGARVVHSSCPGMVVRAPADAEKLVFATDSLKVAMLFAGIGWPKNWLGTRKDVIQAAITGTYVQNKWLN